MTKAQTVNISLDEFDANPYPCFKRLREVGGVAWVPAMARYLITDHEQITAIDRRFQTFVAADPEGVSERTLGPGMVSKDGPEHRRQRTASGAAFRPKTIQDDWMPVFQRNANAVVDKVFEDGRADLPSDIAAPLSTCNLAGFIGLRDVSDQQMQEWSAAIIAGASNYGRAPEVWAVTDAAVAEMNERIDEACARVRDDPDASVICAMLHAPEPLSHDEIYYNVRVIIGGGVNEPKAALGAVVLGLLTHPDQLAEVQADPKLWKPAFEEALRWMTPIGFIPRTVAEPAMVAGVQLEPGDRIGLLLNAANSDPNRYENPNEFDIHRESKPHLGFGSGPHICMGAWMSRASIGEIAAPTLFRRLPGLRLADPDAVRVRGWLFRGPQQMEIAWDV